MVKKPYPADAWEYADWLYCSGRLTAEEHLNLKKFMAALEGSSKVNVDEFENEGC